MNTFFLVNNSRSWLRGSRRRRASATADLIVFLQLERFRCTEVCRDFFFFDFVVLFPSLFLAFRDLFGMTRLLY